MELNVGGTSFKGVWLAVLLSFSSTLGGGIWAASEFFSRLNLLEETVEESLKNTELVSARFNDLKEEIDEDLNDADVEINKVTQQLLDNDVAGLQGKLATLGTNLKSIMDRQQELITLGERIVEVEKKITETETLVSKAEILFKDADKINNKLDVIQKEIDDLWNGLDYLSNPYGS